jgi:ABC-type hemin transport system ATPase subunit
MLSQGNLNTAALTLFLALNLSVLSQLPWLVLDDPVQSMDDVHIAQFAALLRTFSTMTRSLARSPATNTWVKLNVCEPILIGLSSGR